MVRITERIVNTYYARIFFCKVPIYMNKQIVLTDAIVYGTQRGKNAKSVYDVSLDRFNTQCFKPRVYVLFSAEEGTDLLAEELHLIRSLYTAITEERYQDAVILRDKLTKLQTPRYEF
ncbi:hypothetical protein IFM89_020386 [Coptis chinensis]|uniref:UVR domain-containing protein n=1 Tax=Coptis chinensis TaxID=261450 RepID=A0A835HR20_9MAGN|nr:hypothetical protein IFM89_020386 [Coptis chinensis]